MVSWVEWNGIE